MKVVRSIRLLFHRLCGFHKLSVRERQYRCVICGYTTYLPRVGDTLTLDKANQN